MSAYEQQSKPLHVNLESQKKSRCFKYNKHAEKTCFYAYKNEYERSLKAAKYYNVCQRKRNRVLYSDIILSMLKKESASINLAFLKKDKVCWLCDNTF